MPDEIHDLPDTPTVRDRIIVVRHRPEAIVCTTYGVMRASGRYGALDYDVIWPKPVTTEITYVPR